jgi:hypothetical protein
MAPEVTMVSKKDADHHYADGVRLPSLSPSLPLSLSPSLPLSLSPSLPLSLSFSVCPKMPCLGRYLEHGGDLVRARVRQVSFWFRWPFQVYIHLVAACHLLAERRFGCFCAGKAA